MDHTRKFNAVTDKNVVEKTILELIKADST